MGQTARAFLTGPARQWRDLPAVIYCHAHGNRYDIGAAELIEGRPALTHPPYAKALADAGIVALALDLPCFGERAAETESAAAKRHLWRGTTLFGQMLAELGGLQAFLAEIDGVDSTRVGAFGISMGATLAFWLGALEPRIKAVAQLCCFADMDMLIQEGAHDLHGVYLTVPGLARRFSTGTIAGLVAPRPQLISIGDDDPLTPGSAADKAIGDVTAAYAALDATSLLTIKRSGGTGHQETAGMRRDVITFLRDRL